MNDLLFLAHRLPYPPNKGDKIRSFHWLAHLARRYRVYLGAFVDDPNDFQYEAEVAKYCEDYCIRPLGRVGRLVGTASAYFRGQPLTLGYYADSRLQAWIDAVVSKKGIRRAFVFSAAMAQFVETSGQCSIVTDLVDVDSEKWRQYSTRRSWPLSYLLAREARKLLEYERETAKRSARVLFVTSREARLFTELAPETAGNVHVVENGVDVEYFSPDRVYVDPYSTGARVLVFTGAMDYWANVDAVSWFVSEILPQVRARVHGAEFWIVGARPTRVVRNLAAAPGVHVTGTVPDVRPYLQHARAAVIPLRVARGIQNKVLEAFALGRPVVATSAALDALELPAALDDFRADEPVAFAQKCVGLLGAPRAMRSDARAFVLGRYRWDDKARLVEGFIEGVAPFESHARSSPP